MKYSPFSWMDDENISSNGLRVRVLAIVVGWYALMFVGGYVANGVNGNGWDVNTQKYNANYDIKVEQMQTEPIPTDTLDAIVIPEEADSLAFEVKYQKGGE